MGNQSSATTTTSSSSATSNRKPSRKISATTDDPRRKKLNSSFSTTQNGDHLKSASMYELDGAEDKGEGTVEEKGKRRQSVQVPVAVGEEGAATVVRKGSPTTPSTTNTPNTGRVARKRSTVKAQARGGTVAVGGVGYGAGQEDQYLNGYAHTPSTIPASITTTSNNSSSTSTSANRRTSITGSGAGGFVTRQRSVRRSEPNGHPITPAGREIIQLCFENPHTDLGVRICTRLYERRPDYAKFILQVGRDKFPTMANNLKEFLDTAVTRIDNLEALEQLARKYGEEHVSLKSYGFKPDFWVSLADAITVEAVILDQASHQPTDTVTAWSLFIALLFSAIRDGYYTALRAHRISERKKSFRLQKEKLLAAAGASDDKGDGDEGVGVEVEGMAAPTTPEPRDSSGSMEPKDLSLIGGGPVLRSMSAVAGQPRRKDSLTSTSHMQQQKHHSVHSNEKAVKKYSTGSNGPYGQCGPYRQYPSQPSGEMSKSAMAGYGPGYSSPAPSQSQQPTAVRKLTSELSGIRLSSQPAMTERW